MSAPLPDRPAPSGDGPPEPVARRLAEPPSARYGQAGPGPAVPSRVGHWTLSSPMLQAVVIAAVGSGLLFLLGGLLSTTVGLLFIAAVMGAGIGLTLAGLAVSSEPDGQAAGAPLPRAAVRRVAVLLGVSAVLVAAIATWLFARSEGGALGIVDYLWSTFGLLVPAEAVLAAIGAAWGAGAGPVSRA